MYNRYSLIVKTFRVEVFAGKLLIFPLGKNALSSPLTISLRLTIWLVATMSIKIIYAQKSVNIYDFWRRKLSEAMPVLNKAFNPDHKRL